MKPTATHACEGCGTRVLAPTSNDRIETITACEKGGTCTYVRIAATYDR